MSQENVEIMRNAFEVIYGSTSEPTATGASMRRIRSEPQNCSIPTLRCTGQSVAFGRGESLAVSLRCSTP